jgi:hypothetical protein
MLWIDLYQTTCCFIGFRAGGPGLELVRVKGSLLLGKKPA